ncbi:F-box protein At2g32560-like [Triticum urartu]|uniref:F-box domain-containing protein n=1 Tax=Triticum urartu TaxID=4572 RepID=A0A8R7PSJ6_TRIUA|nr:F-box protein At2g32560-like [Triticum dicoccoides]XP_048563109.1 F-box protein At2g32560-like [Triticum urartu]
MLALVATFVFSCLLFLSKPCARDMRLFLASISQQLALSLLGFLAGYRLLGGVASRATATAVDAMPLMPSFKRKRPAAKLETTDTTGEPSVLDLPELAIDCILAKLPPAELRNMAAVSRSMRERCRSDHLWERHMSDKWGSVLGTAARDEWRSYLSSSTAAGGGASGCGSAGSGKHRRWLAALSCVCPVVSWMRPRADGGAGTSGGPVLDDSIMSWYLHLESSKFWFPAQVYNREHGHVGFMMSCYDAELSYDFRTDTFHARYPPHGRRTVVLEDGVQWDRVRAPPVGTLAHDLHASDCLHELRPGDNIEIQWRRNKEFPYGWWYGVVGHLESCDGNEHFCRCHLSDTVVLEFNQYTPGSRWRQSLVNRKDHREEGNESDGFYGGIRKLQDKDEISKWKQLWPTDILE